MKNNNFNQYITDPAMLQNLSDIGYAQITPIQQACLPLVIAGKVETAKAITGSGNTAAFGVPILLR
ncbi:MAG: hypothetical protein PHE60_03830 [Sulfurospirillaceae bacterium]|nr:hypothetical protein [Sulfurospirillaceae bacterium]